MLDGALYLCRFVQFAATFAVFGAASFRHYAVAENGNVAAAQLGSLDVRLSRLGRAGALLVLASALAYLLCQSASMAGSTAAMTDPAILRAVLFETRFGRVWSGHLLLAVLLVLVSLRSPGGGQLLVLILSALVLASLAWVGHAVAEPGVAGTGHALNQTVHLLAAGLWLGGLLPLGWVLREARAMEDGIGLPFARRAVRHFSQMGYFAVALIAITGAINSVLLVGSFEAMFGTAYGRLLMVKIALFLTMVAIAALNRFRLAPRVCRDGTALGALCRSIWLEQAIGLSILAVVSILGTLPPAI